MGRKSHSNKEYALYQGDEFIMIGTRTEIAKELGVREDTVRFYASETYKKRTNGNGLVVVECDDD